MRNKSILLSKFNKTSLYNVPEIKKTKLRVNVYNVHKKKLKVLVGLFSLVMGEIPELSLTYNKKKTTKIQSFFFNLKGKKGVAFLQSVVLFVVSQNHLFQGYSINCNQKTITLPLKGFLDFLEVENLYLNKDSLLADLQKTARVSLTLEFNRIECGHNKSLLRLLAVPLS